MSANFLGREKGYKDITGGGFQEAGLSIAEHFAPAATYPERIDRFFAEVAALGFRGIDLWTAHCSPAWATPQHLDAVLAASARHGVELVSIAGGLGNSWEALEQAVRLASDLRVPVIGLGAGPELIPARLPEVNALLEKNGVRFAFENHPNEPTPAVVLEKIGHGKYGAVGATLDTGWFATHGYKVEDAIDELGSLTWLVHLKNIVAPGGHVAARWDEGCLDFEPIVRHLRRVGYDGWISVEYEPTDCDPSQACRQVREMIELWWSPLIA